MGVVALMLWWMPYSPEIPSSAPLFGVLLVGFLATIWIGKGAVTEPAVFLGGVSFAVLGWTARGQTFRLPALDSPLPLLVPILAGSVLLVWILREPGAARRPGAWGQRAVWAGMAVVGVWGLGLYGLLAYTSPFKSLYYVTVSDLVTLSGHALLVGTAYWVGGEVVRVSGWGRILPILLGLLVGGLLVYGRMP
jgi:hypothetical protein